jgi:hypothetical protein
VWPFVLTDGEARATVAIDQSEFGLRFRAFLTRS